MTVPDARPDGDVVEVAVPADVAYVATLRLAAASLAVRCDLNVDDIEDLRLAVDEACSLALPHARPNSVLRAHFELAAGRLSVTARVDTVDQTSASLDRSGFGWSLLSALASEVVVSGDAEQLAITVTKHGKSAAT